MFIEWSQTFFLMYGKLFSYIQRKGGRMTETRNHEELLELGNSLLKLRSTMEVEHFKNVFKEMSFLDYEILSLLVKRLNLHTADKIYLSEVGTELNIPIQQVSMMTKNLQGKGLVYWNHDKSGKGTYIKLSELGKEKMDAQQQKLLDYFSSIVNRIGLETFKTILSQLEQLEEIMIEESMHI